MRDEIVKSLTISADRESDDSEPTLENVSLGETYFVNVIKGMRHVNADYCSSKFTSCKKLLNYNIEIIVTDTVYAEKYRYRIKLKNLLERFDLIK